MARADGSLRSLLARLSRIDVLVIDDWAMAPLSEPERRDFWEICEDRYQVRSTILTSQLPVSRWHEQIGDPTLADGILDRLVHNAHSRLTFSDGVSQWVALNRSLRVMAFPATSVTVRVRGCSRGLR
jgi:DNA replication protein DnaC